MRNVSVILWCHHAWITQRPWKEAGLNGETKIRRDEGVTVVVTTGKRPAACPSFITPPQSAASTPDCDCRRKQGKEAERLWSSSPASEDTPILRSFLN
jgi:hypothetical protein